MATVTAPIKLEIIGVELFVCSESSITKVNLETGEVLEINNGIKSLQGFAVYENQFLFSTFSGGIYTISFDPEYQKGTIEDFNSQCEIQDITAPIANDACSGEIIGTTEFDFSRTQEEGLYEITWFFKDGNENSTIQKQNVIIDDITKPVPALKTLLDITAECEVTSLEAPFATDNCSTDVIITHNAVFPISGEGTTTVVTWTYDDGNGNTITQTQNVIIDDVTKPVPALNTLLDITAECEVTSLEAPFATDNCSTDIIITHNAVFPISGEGTTTVVTWTYNDGNGNTTTQKQNVIIDDVTAPVPAVETLLDITAECEVTSLETPFATDNCVENIIIASDATFPIIFQGTTLVTWTYNDGNGNISSQTQNIIIDDVTAPIVEIEVLEDVLAVCEVTVLDVPLATDNCVEALTVTSDVEFPVTDQGTTVITWTYNDGNGNTTTQTQNIIINDTEKPFVDVSDLETIYSECDVTSIEAPTATDNCRGTITGVHTVSLPINGNGTTTEITWTFDDGNGN
ncbi:MAG: hypothetical protein JKY08_04590, partial [Flavobacteriaceae bacterium]|nr:hypothetical protein [Flavobacteriaceae bacterium]